MPDENDKNLNPGQADYDRKTAFDPSGSKVNENSDESVAKNSGENIDNLREAEKNPDDGYINNFNGNNKSEKQGFSAKLKAAKKGPLLAIGGLLVSGVGIIGFFGNPALITQTILANLISTYNSPQEASLSRRYSRMISSKLSGEATSGQCNIIQIACRYTRPSNAFLKKLDKYGLKAYGKDGLIKSNGIFPNERPISYKFTGIDGKTIDIEAKYIYKEFINNSEFRSAFNSASKMRFASLTDSVFKKVKARLGYSTMNKSKTVASDDDLEKQLDGENKPNDEIKAAAAGASDAIDDSADNAAKKLLTEGATKELDKLTKAGKGDAVGLAAGAVCLIGDVPKLITSTARSYQMIQIVKYGAVFLSAFGAIKAGDATPEQSTAIANALTEEVDGKSAMDAFGMKNAINGDKFPSDDNYKKFIPGYGVSLALGAAVVILNGQVKSEACSIMTNPVTGQAINVGLSSTGAGIVVAGVNIVAGYVLAEVAEKVLPSIISAAIEVIPTEKILSFFYGDITKNVAGESIGNLVPITASIIAGQTGNAGGNGPLSIADAVTNEKVIGQVQQEYAEEDRATKSPFDTSSPNTLMGSIVQKITPYFIKSSLGLSSIATKMGSMVNMIFGSFGTLLKPITTSATDDDSAQYKLCDDPVIKDNDIATGPFCNIIYGVPEKYLNIDPVEVIKHLVDSGDIDENTGEIIPNDKKEASLSSWIDLCTDGTTIQASNCKITDETAYYALYMIDSRVIEAMDGVQSTTNTYDSKSAIELANTIITKGTVEDSTGQIAEVAAGTRTNIDVDVLKLIAQLSENNTFTISSLFRDDIPDNGSLTSYHLTGKAVDISGGQPINGETINYTDYSSNTQKSINEASSLLGTSCQIGLPNDLYVKSTKIVSNCSVFFDIGTGAHIHFAVGG